MNKREKKRREMYALAGGIGGGAIPPSWGNAGAMPGCELVQEKRQEMKIVLAQLRKSDIPALHEIINLPENREELFQDSRWIRQEEIEGILYETETGTTSMTFGIFAEERLLGCIALNNIYPRNRSGNITHLALHPDGGFDIALQAGIELVKYGFNTLNLHRMECRAYKKNRLTPLLCKKVGGAIVADIPDAIYRDGKYEDLIIWSLLKKEWKNGSISTTS